MISYFPIVVSRPLRCLASRAICALLLLTPLFAVLAMPDASAQVAVVVGGVVTAPSADVPRADDWPQWRGPGRDGIAAATPVWPADLGEETLVEQWRRPFGPSYSGPLVVGERLFTTETRNGQQEAVTALDRRSGEVLWEAVWEGAMQVPFFAAANGSWIRATPACDGERVYAAGMRDVLVCLDVTDGRELWKLDFMETYGTPLPAFGFASSPLLFGDALYVQAAASIVKLDKRTGDVLWRTADTTQQEMDSAFSSPIVARLHDREILVVQARDALKGLDPATGDVLWSQNIQAFQGMNILTPTVYENSLLTSAHSGRTQFWQVAGPDAEEAGLQEAWSLPMQGYMSSPVVIGGHAYLHLRNQRLSCLDLESGKEQWRTEPYGKYWSLAAQGERILALDERGDLLLIEASPEEFRLLDRRHVTDATSWAHVAISGEQVFVRALDALICYRWKAGAGSR